MRKNELSVVCYNIHKGLNTSNQRCTIKKIKQELDHLNADIILLQEVQGSGSKIKKEIKDRIKIPQHDYLAKDKWTHQQYGKNAIYQTGDHGNAILSKIPIIRSENFEISTNRFEKRGILHCVLKKNKSSQVIHIFCTHLNLRKKGRILQIKKIINLIKNKTNPKDIIILGGDFNEKIYGISELLKEVNLIDSYKEIHQFQAKTFPSIFPIFPLDRIYHRKIKPVEAKVLKKCPWNQLSDHLPIWVNFKY